MSGLANFGARALVSVGKAQNARLFTSTIIPAARGLHTSKWLCNEQQNNNNSKQPTTSLFGDMTEYSKADPLESIVKRANNLSTESDEVLSDEEQQAKRLVELKETVTPANDETLQEFLSQQFKPLVALDELLSPLKKEVYLANVAKNGFFKNDQLVTLPDGKKYKLSLSKAEIEALEPSVYLKSYRFDTSMKKLTLVNRLLNQLPLKEAITQCHFSRKKAAKDIGTLLETGFEKAKELNIDSSSLYISQIWTGDDGFHRKRIEWKGRGRMGVIKHRNSHVRVILRTEQTKKRLAYEAGLKQEKKKVWEQLPNEVIRGATPGFFKW